ncbi:DUF6286 domain-containing protein [Streptosporangium soli]|nr:DUF6286 domain-containing protein [Streptosporangium sp. KLBMP 9127]
MTTTGAHRVATPTLPGSGGANRAAARAFRPRRSWPAVIAAVALLVVGLVVALEIISALLQNPARLLPYDSVQGWANATRWNDTGVIVTAAVVTALGLLLLLIALIPGRPRYVPLLTGDRDLIIGLRRRSFARALSHAAEGVDGVSGARTRVHGNHVHVTATTPLHETGGLDDAIRQAVSSKLTSLAPASSPHLSVSLRNK